MLNRTVRALASLSLVAAAAATGSFAMVTPGAAQSEEDNVLNKLDTGWTFYGLRTPAKIVRDEGVQGGRAYKVSVSKGSNAWAVGATTPMAKPVQKGHRIAIAFWAKAGKVEGGETGRIEYFAVERNAEPRTQVVSGSADLGPEWKLIQAQAVAPQDFAPSELTVTAHLAARSQTLQLGPIAVLDLGPAK